MLNETILPHKIIPKTLPNPTNEHTLGQRSLLLTLLGALAIVAAGVLGLHSTHGVTTSIELKILGIAVAVGFDILALSIAIGIMQIPLKSRIRLGIAFSGSEVLMQVVGYAIGSGADRLVGTIADYIGFAVLAIVGIFIVKESFSTEESEIKVDFGWGLLVVCASVSLDSLGIGLSLPGVPLPLIPLLATVAVSTTLFTAVGLAFGTLLGRRYQHVAQRSTGIVLVLLAAFFSAQHIWGWGA
jgi:putative Mn2+ efflux pump MntP